MNNKPDRKVLPVHFCSRFLDILFLVILIVGLASCGDDPGTISTNGTLGGTVNVPVFTVARDATLSLANSLTVNADADIIIEGKVVAADENGASITLRSLSGDIYILGSIAAADGAAGANQTGHLNVTGLAGQPGGDILLIAATGKVVISGELTAGRGGDGGSAEAGGPGPRVYAESGPGGVGGQIQIAAAQRIELANAATGAAAISAGDGGDGGRADAEIQGANPLDLLAVDAGGNNEADEDTPANSTAVDPLDQGNEAPEHIAVGTTAQSRAMCGGQGGRVTLQATAADGEILIQGDIEGGDGGSTGQSMASGSDRAMAESQAAAGGGNVEITTVNPLRTLSFTFPEAGNGGNNGGIAGPVQAFAIGNVTALAEVTGGGAAGQVFEQGAVVGSGIGGSTGHAQARVPGVENLSPGQTRLDATPAPAIIAKAP